MDLSFAASQNNTLSTARNSSTVGGVLFLWYQSFHNSPAAQKNTSISLHTRPYRTLAATSLNNTKTQDLYGNFGISSSNLKYADNQTFKGYRLNLQYINTSRNLFFEDFELNGGSSSDIRNGDHRISLNMPLTIGKGRIEQVDDARHGLFILQALQKNNYLAREISEEDILAFAAHISELKNRRYFDFRLQKIWELEQINAFLQERGIIEEESIGYFAIVQDIWNFGNQPRRRAGSRFSVGVNPNVLYNLDRDQRTDISLISIADTSETADFRGTLRFRPALYADFIHEKPLSESWQEVFQAQVQVGIENHALHSRDFRNGRETKENFNAWEDTPFVNAFVYYGLRFYPNTRTYFEGNINTRFSQSSFIRSLNTQPDPLEDFSSLETNLGLNAYYYISPQTRLRITYSSVMYSSAERSLFDGEQGYLDALFTGSQLNHRIFLTLSYAWF